RLRRAQARRRSNGRGAHRLVPKESRELQVSALRGVHGAAENLDRQDSEIQVARDGKGCAMKVACKNWLRYTRAATLALLAALLSGTAAIGEVSGKPELPNVRLAVGGKPALFYLPLTVTERLGYFRDEGLNVEISDFPGGARALQALIGGSADVVTGAYD